MCAYPLRVRVLEKNGSLLTFFNCFHVCVTRTGLRDVSLVRKTESLQERFFHALRTLAQQIAPLLRFPWFNSLI